MKRGPSRTAHFAQLLFEKEISGVMDVHHIIPVECGIEGIDVSVVDEPHGQALALQEVSVVQARGTHVDHFEAIERVHVLTVTPVHRVFNYAQGFALHRRIQGLEQGHWKDDPHRCT